MDNYNKTGYYQRPIEIELISSMSLGPLSPYPFAPNFYRVVFNPGATGAHKFASYINFKTTHPKTSSSPAAPASSLWTILPAFAAVPTLSQTPSASCAVAGHQKTSTACLYWYWRKPNHKRTPIP